MTEKRPESVECPKCHGINIDFIKSWEMKNPRSGIVLTTELWYCKVCRKKFRWYEWT